MSLFGCSGSSERMQPWMWAVWCVILVSNTIVLVFDGFNVFVAITALCSFVVVVREVIEWWRQRAGQFSP